MFKFENYWEKYIYKLYLDSVVTRPNENVCMSF